MRGRERAFARVALAALAALSVSACNMVVTHRPLLASVKDGDHLRLAPGTWLVADDQCKVDVSRGPRHWPECAQWLVNHSGRLYFGEGSEITKVNRYLKVNPGAKQRGASYRILVARPNIMQVKMPGQTDYIYVALDPRTLNDKGEISRFRYWFVLCGPPPKGKAALVRSPRPFAGLTFVQPDDQTCTTDSPAALVAAAAMSRTLWPVQEVSLVRPWRGGGG